MSPPALHVRWILLALASQAGAIEHENPRFKFMLPSGYTRMEFPKGTPPEMVYGFTRRMGAGNWDGMVLTMRILPLTIDKGYINAHLGEYAQELHGSTQSKMVVKSAYWNGEELEVLEHRYVKDEPRIMLTTIVPLFTKSLEINLVAAQKYEREAQDDLRSLLYKLEAHNGWRIRRQSEKARFAGLPGGAGLILGPAYFIAWLGFFRKSPVRAHLVRTAWLATMMLCFAASLTMGFVVGQDFTSQLGPVICTPWLGGGLTLLSAALLTIRLVRYTQAKRASAPH